MQQIKRKIILFLFALAALSLAHTPVSAETIPEGYVENLQFSAGAKVFSQTIYFNGTDEVWYSYVPESTGYYDFSVDGAELSIYDSAGEYAGDGWCVSLEQGQTYYFCFAAEEIYDFYGSATVTIQPLVSFAYSGGYDEEDALGLAKDGTMQLALNNQVWVQSATWSSSDPSVIAVDNGNVTAISEGCVVISVNGTLVTGTEFSETIYVRVTDPKLNRTSMSLNLYTGTKITWGSAEGYYDCTDNALQVQGVTETNNITVRVLDESGAETKKVYVDVDYWYYGDAYDLYVYPKKVGTYTIEVSVDGKLLNCKLNVFKMYFKKNAKTVADGKSKTWLENTSMLAMYPKETTVLTVKGALGKIKWTSSDKSVAKVDSKGKVTARRAGYATITATSGNAVITYQVGVADKTAVIAVRKCYEMYGKTAYSQEKRMSSGYADCSSFVWKGYKAAEMSLGNSSYALTAAGLSDWCKSKGYRIFYGEADVSALLPGDLIFWCGADNDRSDGIYHVDLYQGNYTTITVEKEKWLWSSLTDVIVARPCIHTTSGVTVKNAGGHTQTVSWNKLYGVTGYEIYRSTSANGTYTKVAAVKGDSTTSWTSEKLTKGKTYYYKIRPYWRANKKTYRADYTAEAHGKVK